VFVARKGAAIVGAYVMLVEGPFAIAFAIGVDPGEIDDYTYFRLGYYASVEYAAAHGIERIYFGRGMYAAKLRRGCRLIDAWTYSRANGPIRLWTAPAYALATVWNRAKVAREIRIASSLHNGSNDA
jgi:hypothetical protein